MMKHFFIAALAIAGFAAAHALIVNAVSGSQVHNGSNMPAERMEMMQGMKDMKDMPMGQAKPGKTHRAMGTVQSMDTAMGTLTIAHGPVKSLNWQAMTMTFGVRDKMLLDKMAKGKKVEVEFVQEGSDYTIVKVK